MKLSKKLIAWIVEQCLSAAGLLRVELERRLDPNSATKLDCRLLYGRIVKPIAAAHGLNAGRWRDADDRRFTRFTMDKSKPRHRVTVAEAR